LTLTQQENDGLIQVGDRQIATLQNVQVDDLNADDFVFI